MKRTGLPDRISQRFNQRQAYLRRREAEATARLLELNEYERQQLIRMPRFTIQERRLDEEHPDRGNGQRR
jgi:hypothetical protein